MHTPDFWTILKITRFDEIHYRVFGCWSGGFIYGDSWRMNSGIADVIENEFYFDFVGRSGSIYRCHKNGYGVNMYGSGVLKNYLDQANEAEDTSLEILTEEQALEYIKKGNYCD